MNPKTQDYILALILGMLIIQCCSDPISEESIRLNDESGSTQKIFNLIESSRSGIHFNNKIVDTEELNVNRYDYHYSGAGVALGDINNDGLVDVFFAGNLVDNKLYLNKGDFNFEDISLIAGIEDKGYWSNGVAMFDINEDGWLDIYISHGGQNNVYGDKHQNHLYINNQDGSFTERAVEYGLTDNSFSSQICQIDYDLDGDLDLYLMNHTDFKSLFRRVRSTQGKHQQIDKLLKNPEKKEIYSNRLFENLGNNTFQKSDIDLECNIVGYGLGLAVSDVNKDGKPDLYVGNDYEVPDYLFMNKGDGKLKDENKTRLGHVPHFSMGCDIADLNNDAWVDIVNVDMTASDRVRNKTLMRGMDERTFRYLTNKKEYQEQYMFNTMQLNNGNGTFSDIGQLTGTAQTDWSWSALLADFDLDGDKDYLVTNGFKRDTKNRDVQQEFRKEFGNQPVTAKVGLDILKRYPSVPLENYMFRNDTNLEFTNVSKQWGFTHPSFTNGAAYGDLDNDGDLDVVMNNIDAEAFIYQNMSQENGLGHYLNFHFGTDPRNLNAKVTCYYDDQMQYQEFHPIRGYWSCMEPIIHFGFPNGTVIDSITIEYLSGFGETITHVNLDTSLHLTIEKTSKINTRKESKSIFTTNTNINNILNHSHIENAFWDFSIETLLPHKQSTNGPNVAVGDVDNNGYDDMFIGASMGKTAVLYLQDKNGKFKQSITNPWNEHSISEDIGTCFFDFDNDDDLDLFVVSGGGGEYRVNGPALRDRIYENDGTGRFSYKADILPDNFISGSKVKAADYDNDGDLDLIIGGRLMPKNYPVKTKTTLLRNDSGRFVDVTPTLCPELNKIGMVTDIEWLDLNNDGLLDFVLTGEWMDIRAFTQHSTGFKDETSRYFTGDNTGWWFSLEQADLDGDGDLDLVAGNLGLNNKFHASQKKPFEIYFNDFDDNGKNDIVLAKMDEGNQYLLRGKDCSTQQMPFIKDKFPQYEMFANATIEEVLGEDKLNSSLHYKVEDFSSAIFIFENGKFSRKQLPIEAQFAPIQDIIVEDFTHDGLVDILLAGNLFGTEVETQSYDAGTGCLLVNTGGHQFKALSTEKSGIYLPEDVRDLEKIAIDHKKYIVVANNNDKLQFLAYN